MVNIAKFIQPLLNVLNNIGKFVSKNKNKSLRQNIFALLNPTPHSYEVNKYIDYVVILAVLTSVICIILETVQEVNSVWSTEFKTLDILTVTIFSIEYVLRVYSCCEIQSYSKPIRGRMLYIFSPSALIDLLAISPFYISLIVNKLI